MELYIEVGGRLFRFVKTPSGSWSCSKCQARGYRCKTIEEEHPGFCIAISKLYYDGAAAYFEEVR